MKILSFINKIREKKYLKRIRKNYTGPNDLTIISNNCLGGIISHNLQLKFYSPTVNLGMEAKDFLNFISDLDWYLKKEVSIFEKDDICPWGQIAGDSKHPDIHIRFVHYKSFDEGKLKWEERTSRVTKNVIFIFDFYDKKYNVEYLKKYYDIAGEKNNYLSIVRKKSLVTDSRTKLYVTSNEQDLYGEICKFKGLTGKRYLEQINYVDWINKIFK